MRTCGIPGTLLALLIAGSTPPSSTAAAAPVVLSVDRLHRSGQATPASLVEAGEILLSELNCVNCHAAEGPLAGRIPWTPAPALNHSFTKLKPGYLEKWLADPHGTKPGTRMPDVLAGLPADQRARAAQALAEFINTLPADGLSRPERLPAGNIQHGRELFHSIGCVACHAPRPDFKQTAAGEAVDAAEVRSASVPLGKLGDKYTWHGLAGFLKNPHAGRPMSRMPRVPMTDAERTDLTSYLLADATPGKPRNQTGALRLVDEGRRFFTELGCANCHDARDGKPAGGKPLQATPLDVMIPARGCLTGDGRAARFHLDDFQQRALAAALDGLAERGRMSTAEATHRRMVSLNCYSCHERDQRGGADGERLKYFVSSGSDLGDEGRVPPILTGVGRKLRRDAMRKIIRGEFPARPYMTTRMPDFGDGHAVYFSHIFARVDHDPDEKPTPRDGEENQVGRNMWGRALLGTKGLSCITCHRLNGRKSLGIQAMDLAHSTQRLRPEWFRDYLIEPAKYRPGTRMPSFWPQGKPMVRIGGKTERQIDSIWVYLNELDQSRLPEGMEKTGDFLLKPAARPIVFRTFMEHAGMHAIAVGHPASTHAAFDSQQPRWAIAWTGKFLDAESTWDDRFTPLAEPQGTNVIAIQPQPPVHGVKGAAEFKGYRLDLKSGHPVFHYRIGETSVTDTLLPAAAGGKRMTRTLTREAGEPAWIEVANGKVLKRNGSKWTVDGGLKISTAAKARVVKSAKGAHLQVHVKNTAAVSYEW